MKCSSTGARIEKRRYVFVFVFIFSFLAKNPILEEDVNRNHNRNPEMSLYGAIQAKLLTPHGSITGLQVGLWAGKKRKYSNIGDGNGTVFSPNCATKTTKPNVLEVYVYFYCLSSFVNLKGAI